MHNPGILIIEDDDLQYEIYEETLGACQLTRVLNGTDALAVLAKNPPNLIILDHVLADGSLASTFCRN